MSADSRKSLLKPVRERKYLNKTFDSFKSDLVEYAKVYFPDKVKDLTEASFAGLSIELAAYIGDVTSYYLDHQFSELDVETAVESQNIERALRSAGVKVVGASPAIVDVTVYIEVPAVSTPAGFAPNPAGLPIVQQGSVFGSQNGTLFNLLENIDFTATDTNGFLRAAVALGRTGNDGTPLTYILQQNGLCISGFRVAETFSIGSTFVPFREITLGNASATNILNVFDTLGNVYYEVSALTEDVVYRAIANPNISDVNLVKDALELVPAPYRFITRTDLGSRLTTLVFGGGSADTLNDDVIPDPSEFALPLYGKRTFSRPVLNPDMLLQTKTLGVAATNTTITVDYIYGGGLSHNIEPNTLTDLIRLFMIFPNNPPASLATQVRGSTELTNKSRASGGEDAPTIDELKIRVPAQRNAQSRIVSKEDLLARIYTMPSNFGRVFRAGVRSNPNNPLASQVFIISRNEQNQLIPSPDTLKKNLATYLNSLRLISDAIDILDAKIINFQILFDVVADVTVANKNLLLQNIIAKLKKYFDIKNFQIDQPIIISDVHNLIFNTQNVVAVNNLIFKNLNGFINNRSYSSENFDVKGNIVKQMIVLPPGSIAEIRYPDFDIYGQVV